MMFKLLVALLLLATPLYAHAGLLDFLVVVGAALILGPAGFALISSTGVALTIGMAAYGQYKAYEMKKQSEEQEKAARESYNASLKDRTITNVSTEAPHVYVYGRARVGSAVVAILPSGERDEYRHLICVHCAHEVEAIDEIWIAGHALGALNADGFPVNSEEYGTKIRVRKHLGAPGELADAQLQTECPGKWSAAHKLSGYCYTYIRLDLNQAEFQGGIPAIEVLIRGKKILDPRTGITAHSYNNALVMYDYLRSPFCAVPDSDIPIADVITAANVCDEYINIGTFFYGPTPVRKYTFNGTVTSDQDRSMVLTQMAQSMGGGINSTTWSMWAGKYIAPSLALTQSDIVGAISISPGISDADIFNGAKGRFIGPENNYTPTDIKPYQNAVFRAEDGRDLFSGMEFPFTDETQRCHNLARIFIEDQRSSFTIKATFSLKAWDTKIGQRITLTSVFFGFNLKVFRIVGKSYTYMGTVELLLKEDDPAIWDLADATAVDQTPNTELPNPYFIAPPAWLLLSSGVNERLIQADGTVVSRLRASWSASTNVYATMAELQIKKSTDLVWQTAAVVDATLGFVHISPVNDGVVYHVRIRYLNPSLGVYSAWLQSSSDSVTGDTDIPATPTASAVGGLFSVRITWSFGNTAKNIQGTEIWWATTNNRNLASRLSFEPFPLTYYLHVGLSAGQGGYYWIRVVSSSGINSAWFPASATAGMFAQASSDPSAILTQLNNSLGIDQLTLSLRQKIDLIDGFGAALSNETTLRQDADNLEASIRAQVQARLDTGDYAAVKTESSATASAVAGIQARWSVKLDVNGRVTGLQLLNNGATSSFVVLADKFLFVRPDGSGTPIPVLTMGTINGLNALGVNGNLIVDGTVTADKVNGQNLKVMAGGFSSYTWPPAGYYGFYLGPEGLLLGNENNGRYVAIGADGNIRMPGFQVQNGAATFGGTLTAQAVNAVNAINLADNAVGVSAFSLGTNSASASVSIPANVTARVYAVAVSSRGTTVNNQNAASLTISGSVSGTTDTMTAQDPSWGYAAYFASPMTVVAHGTISSGAGGATASVTATFSGYQMSATTSIMLMVNWK